MTEGNAIRWLADNVDGWGRVAQVITHGSTLDVMQLDIQTNKFNADPTAEAPNIVLRFDASQPYDSRVPRIIDIADDRVERRLLEASMRGCVVRIQIPRWQADTHALIVVGTALIIVLGAILAPWFPLVAAAVTAVIAGGIVVADHFLAKTFKAAELTQWFKDAGQDARNVRVRELKLRSTFVTHAKIVLDRDKEAIVLGSPFDQDYFDSLQHVIDEPRRGATPAKGPIHDVSVGVRGPAVAHLQELFDSHWNLADPSDKLQPPATLPAVRTTEDDAEIITPAQVVRTLDMQFAEATNGEKGVLEAYLRGIYFAERFIYIENQYFNNDTITQALIDALKAKPNLRLILLVNVSPDMPFYPGWQQDAIRRVIDSMGSTAKARVGAFTKWSHAASDATHPKPRLIDNYLHTKSALIDNRWATVGSANLDGASLDFVQYARATLDGDLRNTESNIVVYEETLATPSPVDSLRRRLWSEHLGLSGPSDSALDDAPGRDWLQFWTQKAEEKLAGLVVNPNVVSPVQILPWPSSAFEQDYGKHVVSDDYLATLFSQDHQNSAALVSQFDLMPAGPPAFPFTYKP
jgi:phosphatidylserine/phosphatidylglycerophosphate/cardiolipin synthase-like enzyme